MSPSRSPKKNIDSDSETDKTSATASPYRLRETKQLPSRYRDDDTFPSPSKPRKSSSPKKTPQKSQSKGSLTPQQTSESVSPPKKREYIPPIIEVKTEYAIDPSSISTVAVPTEPYRSSARRSLMTPPRKTSPGEFHGDLIEADDIVVGEEEEVMIDSDMSSLAVPIQEPMGMDLEGLMRRDMYHNVEDRNTMIMHLSRYKADELGKVIRSNLKRLCNLLKLPKARQWLICEFFYSGVDEQIFFGENEFVNVLRDNFPELKTYMLNKTEWRTIRRLLGKPRRCSERFFEEERMALEDKRDLIRRVYEGHIFNGSHVDLSDIPKKLPKPLVVGLRVFARVRHPRDGIYAGTIDALVPNGYRIVFEQRDIPASDISDTDVILDGRQELLSLAYFIEEANSRLPTGIRPFVTASRDLDRPHVVKQDVISNLPITPITDRQKAALVANGDDGIAEPRQLEMVGNFPLKFMVILVKLTKLIEMKKKLVKQMTDMNSEAEISNLHANNYSKPFVEKYASIVVELDDVNRHIEENIQGIKDHTQYLPNIELHNVKPEQLRKVCLQQASQFVDHCNEGLNVNNDHALKLIQALTALLLQVRSLGSQKLSACDLQSLSESMSSIRNQISAKNAAYFQDYVEVHMKQIHNIMIESGAVPSVSGLTTRR